MRNPDFEFIPVDTSTMEAEMIAAYEAMTGGTVQPASPERLMIAWVASLLLAERVKSNYMANQNLPSRAEGENLDALAELYYAQERPKAKPATCTVRFSISEAQASAVLIPAGTRVTDGAQTLYWATDADATIPIGSTYADLPVKCQTPGTLGNGYAAGQINTIVDVYDYYSGCVSLTDSGSGADEATDDELYDLLKASMYAYSTAGPRGAYEYHARSVSTEIADVKAVRPRVTRSGTLAVFSRSGASCAFLGGDDLDTATLKIYAHGATTAATLATDYTFTYVEGLLTISLTGTGSLASVAQIDYIIDATRAGRVTIYTLMDDGTIAGAEVKAAVLAACSDDSVRPMSDLVSVADPETVSYDIALTYWLAAGSSRSAADVAAAVTAAVNEYKAWQAGKLGRDINPSYLIWLLMQTGVKRVAVMSPTYTPLHDGSDRHVPQVAAAGTVTIVNGGVEND